MTLRVIEVTAGAGHVDTIQAIAETYEAVDHWVGPQSEEGHCTCRLLVRREKQQAVLDILQSTFSGEQRWRILLLPVEATIPDVSKDDKDAETKGSSVAATREELFNDVSQAAQPDTNFVLLVLLSTIVAAIGLLEDNVAVVIGAMVIAPLLGPNLAFAFGSALGDTGLMWKSVKSNLLGVTLSLTACIVLGVLLSEDLSGADVSGELLARTHVGFDGVALALASGAAAALSLTTGLSSTLVGVMVAVALLPPAATMGMMIGAQQWPLAFGAALLLATNVVCVNLSAQVFFFIKGIKPRTWLEKRKATQSVTANIFVWAALLSVLGAAIYAGWSL